MNITKRFCSLLIHNNFHLQNYLLRIIFCNFNKKALLSQRRPHDAPHIYGCPEKFPESSQTPPATFPEICKGLLFRSILRMCVQNLKFVALSVPEIIGGTQKIWAVPGFAHASYSPKFLKGFCLYEPSEYICQI